MSVTGHHLKIRAKELGIEIIVKIWIQFPVLKKYCVVTLIENVQNGEMYTEIGSVVALD